MSRVGLVLAFCLGLLLVTSTVAPEAIAKPRDERAVTRACTIDGNTAYATYSAGKLRQVAQNAVNKAEKALEAGKQGLSLKHAGHALKIIACAHALGVFDMPKFDPPAPKKQPGSGPDVPPNYPGPHPKTDGYRLPCLGPQGQQWEIWSDNVCRGPDGQSK